MRNKTDKIFDNTFDAPEGEVKGTISFNLDSSVKGNYSEEEIIHYEMLAKEIHELISNSRFKKFNKIDEFANAIKLKKLDINEVYGFMVDELAANYSRIDIFSEMSSYFNIHPTKFYNSLSNVFKEELITELDKKTGILSKKNINKLF
tara:strand:+ start:69 stop:512 length:444 start_codon:yes stop_codon:yes gene_type:complete